MGLRTLTITITPVPVRIRSCLALTLLTSVSADGESMIGLCYRTKGASVPLWLSVGAADNLNRKARYLAHGSIDHVLDRGINIRKSSNVLQRDSNNEVTGQLY